jgi:hypothetical protein
MLINFVIIYLKANLDTKLNYSFILDTDSGITT